MLLKSTSQLDGLVNGARGVVIRFMPDSRSPVVRFVDGAERVVGTETFTVYLNGGAVIARRHQIPLDLSWGMSVHKCQGISVDKAEINLKNVFECGQTYGEC